MKKSSVLFLLLLFVWWLIPITPAAAHQLASDNGVNVVLHVAPDDAPVAGRKAQLIFYLGSQSSSFYAQNCGCQLSLNLRHRQIANPPLQLGTNGATASVTFPQAGVYTVVLSGDTFHVKFVVRVAKSGSPFSLYNLGAQVLAVSMLSLIVLFAIARRTIIDGGRYNKP